MYTSELLLIGVSEMHVLQYIPESIPVGVHFDCAKIMFLNISQGINGVHSKD